MDFKKGGSTVFLATEFRFITCQIIFIFNLFLGPYPILYFSVFVCPLPFFSATAEPFALKFSMVF